LKGEVRAALSPCFGLPVAHLKGVNVSLRVCSWEAWLDESYVAEDIAPLNTLFLAFYVAEPSVANHVTTELIR